MIDSVILKRFDAVVGDEPYVSLHFLGAERYAT
jgi:hypothetical protein